MGHGRPGVASASWKRTGPVVTDSLRASAASSQRSSAAAEAVRHRWGGGNRLGGDPL
jgi:hypothetical protein